MVFVLRVDTPVMLLSYGVIGMAAFSIPSVLLPQGGDGWRYGQFVRFDGVIFVLLLLLYLRHIYNRSAQEAPVSNQPAAMAEIKGAAVHTDSPSALWTILVHIVLGIALLAVGAEMLIRGARTLAIEVFNVSERFVGIAIIAFGTSIPELVTTIVSLVKKEMDISVGNIIGSNIFNGFMVLGVTIIIKPVMIHTPKFIGDFAFMVGSSLLLYLFLLMQKRISRYGAAILLCVYGAYVYYLLSTRTV